MTGSAGGSSSTGVAGLVTGLGPDSRGSTSFRSIMGHRGLGGATANNAKRGGTLILVLSPNEWKPEARYGLFATGHTGEGAIELTRMPSGELEFAAGARNAERSRIQMEAELEAGKWYFIAATWQRDEKPLLYVREIDPAGPGSSPEAVKAEADKVAPETEGPSHDPILIGSHWHNPGSDPVARDAANARIAYVRLDNEVSSGNQIERAFHQLGR